MTVTETLWLSRTWQRSSDFVGVARRKRTNSLREMGEWSSGGCEFCSESKNVVMMLSREWSHLILIGSIKTACKQTLVWTEQPDWDRFKRSLLVCNQRFVRLRKWSYNRSVAYKLWIYVKSCNGNMFARQTGSFPRLIGQKLFKLLCCIPLCSLCQFIKCSK